MKAVVWSKPACPFCVKAKNLLKNKGIEYEEKNIAEGHKIEDLLALVPNARTMPQIWLDGKYVKDSIAGKLTYVGGYDDLVQSLDLS